jgi:hypothetical protein
MNKPRRQRVWVAVAGVPASVRHLATEQHLDGSLLHGDEINTVAKKGGKVAGIRGTNTRKGRKSSRSRTTMAPSSRLSPWRPSMRQTWSCSRRA